jgi:GAF domain-containing protein
MANTRKPNPSAQPEHAAIRERAASLLSESTSVEDVLRMFAALITEKLADLVAIDLVEDDGSIRRSFTQHISASTEQKIVVHRQSYPLNMTSAYGYPRVIKTGKSQFIPGVGHHLEFRLLAALPQGYEDGVAVRSFICVPLIAHGRILGALTVANTDRSTFFASEDLVLLEEITQMLAECLDRML